MDNFDDVRALTTAYPEPEDQPEFITICLNRLPALLAELDAARAEALQSDIDKAAIAELRAELAAANARAEKAESAVEGWKYTTEQTCRSRDALRARVADLEGALRKLSNEVQGLSIAEVEIRDAIGNTNWSVLSLRVEEAGKVLARQPAQSLAAIKAAAITEYIDMNGVTCDCCQHVMIDVTATDSSIEHHCIAGDPEGDGSGCAWCWRQDADGNDKRTMAQALRAVRRKMHRDQTWCQVADMITDEAERLEKEAGNG